MMLAKRAAKYESRDLIVPEPRCAYCSIGIPLDTGTYRRYRGLVPCPTCLKPNYLAFEDAELVEQRPDTRFVITPADAISIPPRSLADYDEALRCLTVGAWKACATMARRAIQGALLERGVSDAPPRVMIDAARNKHGILDEKQHHLATTVTFFGGKGAHPEETEINLITEIEATSGLLVTKTLLLALFPPSP